MKHKKLLYLLLLPAIFSIVSCKSEDECKIKFVVDGKKLETKTFKIGDDNPDLWVIFDSNRDSFYSVHDWYYDKEYTKPVNNYDFVTTESMTLYAKKPIKLKFILEGEVCQTYVPCGEAFDDWYYLEFENNKDGYDGIEWYIDINLTEKMDSDYKITKPTSFYGKYAKNDYDRIEVEYYNQKENSKYLHVNQSFTKDDFIIKAFYGKEVFDYISVNDKDLTITFDDNLNSLKVFTKYKNLQKEITIFKDKDIVEDISILNGDKKIKIVDVFNIYNIDFTNYKYVVKFKYGGEHTYSSEAFDFTWKDFSSNKATYDIKLKNNNTYTSTIDFREKERIKLDNFDYTINQNGDIEIYGIKPNVESKYEEIVLDSKYYIDGVEHKVVYIKNNAFKNNDTIKKIHLPSTIKYISDGAFEGCTNLNYVYYDGTNDKSNYIIIKDRAFKNCNKLKSSNFINNAIEIGESAFENCELIEKAKLNEKIIELKPNTFKNCSSLRNVSLDFVSKVCENAFDGCSALDSADIKDLKFIGDNAFRGCAISKIILNKDIQIGLHPFDNSTNLNYVHNESKYKINEIFGESDLSNITDIYISQPSLGCLEGLDYLTKIIVKNFNQLTLGELFGGTANSNLEEIKQGTNIYYLPKTLKEVQFSSDSLKESVFENCENLSEIKYIGTDNLTKIPDNAFANCINLNTLNLSFDSLKEIGKNAFLNTKLSSKEIKLPSVEVIGANAFTNTGITSMTIGVNCTTIEDNFSNFNSSLAAIKVQDGNPLFKSYYNILYKIEGNGLTLIKCPEKIDFIPKVIFNTTKILDGAFSSCDQRNIIFETHKLPIMNEDAFINSNLCNVFVSNALKGTIEGDKIFDKDVIYQNIFTEGTTAFVIDKETGNAIGKYLIENDTIVVDVPITEDLKLTDKDGNAIDCTVSLTDNTIVFNNKYSEDFIIYASNVTSNDSVD